jgi:hypothetical protein
MMLPMNSGGFYNEPVVSWARLNLQTPVEIKLRFSSGGGKILIYLLLFILPLAFFAVGVVAKLMGVRDQNAANGAFVCGLVLLIPFGLIVLLAELTRGGFAKSLDAEGVNASRGRKLYWGKLYYVDHVSKHTRWRTVKDNQLEMVFENGKVIIPPLIQERERIWGLVNTMPVQVRDDGVPRVNQNGADVVNRPAGMEALMEFLKAHPGPDRQDG